jgi:hypothetical protein
MHFLMQNDAIFRNISQIGLFGTLTVNTFDIAPGWNRTATIGFRRPSKDSAAFCGDSQLSDNGGG